MWKVANKHMSYEMLYWWFSIWFDDLWQLLLKISVLFLFKSSF